MTELSWGRRHPLLRVLAIILAIIIALGTLTWTAFKVSPWPSALVVRSMFDRGGEEMNAALDARANPLPVRVTTDVRYSEGRDTVLDVYRPESAGSDPLPTIVWIHGGGWISGDKGQIANYLKILANEGFTVVGVNYTIAPEATYPTPVVQTMAALGFLFRDADEWGIDPDNMVLAGDSAGSQIAAQTAAIITNLDYAEQVSISPSIPASSLRATVLACGAYDLSLANVEGPFGDFLKTVLWSYTGRRDYASDPQTRTASVLNYVDQNFPASFLTVGNADSLAPQSEAMATKLDGLGVPVDTLFFPKGYEPALQHEYQFDLSTEAGEQALAQIVAFVSAQTGPRP
ncbi:alpha/beta hydrolase [Mycetocola tolaasinivorans]|uniref:Alpha/beta hydrolase n=1 Tax=Mycetocola tolaasinivorans TaxID=76635 RepID=A0A3L7A1A2_9MICO|nr:alpha/beta hydrolase [Mycetocola tolaasinivorans]RLP73212.1 alpha/beta hydrolase [Mycetocola tolaasinivorans]